MSLNKQAFINFYDRWSEKANSISLYENDIGSYFDKFITLYIIFNRLYAEATYSLYDQNPDDSDFEDIDITKSFPDSKGANKVSAQ